VTLNNRVEIPQLGFGVFQVPPAETQAAVVGVGSFTQMPQA
jgi:diketogulonate reductase-like aldo/keto reductase